MLKHSTLTWSILSQVHYTQKILDLPKQNQITAAPSGSHAADGMIGTVNTKSKKKSSKDSSPIITFLDSPTGDSSAKISADIHVVESSTTKSKSVGRIKERRRIKRTKVQRRNLKRRNPMMKSANLFILVSFVMMNILQETALIVQRLRRLSRVPKLMLF